MPRKCYCGNQDLKEYSNDYWKCTICGTLVSKTDFDVSIYSVEDEKSDLYGESYWKKNMLQEAGVSSIDELLELYFKGRVPYWMKYILKYIPVSSEVLEVGCGLGQLAYLMKSVGYKQKALELSPRICKFVQDKFNINIEVGELSTSSGKFDAILAFDVFEHLLDPRTFLECCEQRLDDQGILCMQMPCYDETMEYEEMKSKNPRFMLLMEPKQHIFLYSKGAIVKLLKEHGFSHVLFEPAYFGDDYDMFFFASKTSLNKRNEHEIKQELGKHSNGCLIRTILDVADDYQSLMQRYLQVQQDSNDRLERINQLGKILDEKERDSQQRLINNQILEELIGKKEQELSEKEIVIQNQLAYIKELENCVKKNLEGNL